MKTTSILIFVAMTAALVTIAGCASPKQAPREQVNRFDLDGDGYLTREEYSASTLSRAMDFDSLDTDSDGLLSRRELEFRAGSGGREPRGGKRPGGSQEFA